MGVLFRRSTIEMAPVSEEKGRESVEDGGAGRLLCDPLFDGIQAMLVVEGAGKGAGDMVADLE